MRDYELIYIVHPEVDQEGLTAIQAEIKDLVESTGGAVHRVEPWGRRRMAYPIKKVWEGHYVLTAIGMEPLGITELERGLQLKESIIRHLVVRLEEQEQSQEPEPAPTPEPEEAPKQEAEREEDE
jgi:small subunit ribosomal protein S6